MTQDDRQERSPRTIVHHPMSGVPLLTQGFVRCISTPRTSGRRCCGDCLRVDADMPSGLTISAAVVKGGGSERATNC